MSARERERDPRPESDSNGALYRPVLVCAATHQKSNKIPNQNRKTSTVTSTLMTTHPAGGVPFDNTKN